MTGDGLEMVGCLLRMVKEGRNGVCTASTVVGNGGGDRTWRMVG
ncbi:uncharacterized protein G2W53_027595 [Senna tora]|uniref:Uncharacterized protein n=1 Tax=Senna tora TaxID=362788 RepID=A0A834WG65_9FABA|nr:uncharacterized protein G2W53_027595 [Senna tora]